MRTTISTSTAAAAAAANTAATTGHLPVFVSRSPLPAEGNHLGAPSGTAYSHPRGRGSGGCGRSPRDRPFHHLDVFRGLEVSVFETDPHTLNPLRVRDGLQPSGQRQCRRVGRSHAVTPSPPPFSGIVMVSQMILKIG